MKWLLLTCLLLVGILATKSETIDEEETLTINGFENKGQNIDNRIEDEGLEVQNIAGSKNGKKKKIEKKKKEKKKPLKRKRPKLNRNKPVKQKKKRNKKEKKQKLKAKRRKHKKKRIKKGKKARNINGNGKGKGKAKNKNKAKQGENKHKNNMKKKRKLIRKKKKGTRKGRNNRKKKQKTKKIERKERKENAKKRKNKEKGKKKEKAKKRKIKKTFRKKKGKKKEIGKKLVKQASEISCEEIILSRIKLERKAVNYMRQFNRSKRFMGKTDNKLKKKGIWLKSEQKQDPISLLIKCGGNDENNLKCAGATSNKNSVMMTTLLNNLKNCTPNIGSQCDEGKFPAKDLAFDQCAPNLMAYQAKSLECLKKDGAGACACYSTTEATELYDKGKACSASLMQQYERKVLKTKDNCVTKFKDCRTYQDELAVVMMTCCGDGGECPAA